MCATSMRFSQRSFSTRVVKGKADRSSSFVCRSLSQGTRPFALGRSRLANPFGRNTVTFFPFLFYLLFLFFGRSAGQNASESSIKGISSISFGERKKIALPFSFRKPRRRKRVEWFPSRNRWCFLGLYSTLKIRSCVYFWASKSTWILVVVEVISSENPWQ